MGECKDEYHVIDHIDNDKINNEHANLQAVAQENTALGYNDPIQVPKKGDGCNESTTICTVVYLDRYMENNKVSNLEFVTSKENTTGAIGVKMGVMKLTSRKQEIKKYDDTLVNTLGLQQVLRSPALENVTADSSGLWQQFFDTSLLQGVSDIVKRFDHFITLVKTGFKCFRHDILQSVILAHAHIDDYR